MHDFFKKNLIQISLGTHVYLYSNLLENIFCNVSIFISANTRVEQVRIQNADEAAAYFSAKPKPNVSANTQKQQLNNTLDSPQTSAGVSGKT